MPTKESRSICSFSRAARCSSNPSCSIASFKVTGASSKSSSGSVLKTSDGLFYTEAKFSVKLSLMIPLHKAKGLTYAHVQHMPTHTQHTQP